MSAIGPEEVDRLPAPDRPLRLLLLIPYMGPGGAESQLYHLALGLAERGHDVTLVVMVAIRRDVAPLRRAGVRVIDLRIRTRVGKALAVPRLARLARRADVVHCGLWDVSLWGRLAAALARRPALVAEHSGGREIEVSVTSGAGRGRWIALHNRLLRPVTYAWVTCAEVQAETLRAEGARPDQLVHVPNAVPIDELRAQAAAGVGRDQLGLPADALVVIQVGRLVALKNHPLAFSTVARLRDELGDVRLLVAGDGPERERLEELARERGAADWITFLGARSDVPALLSLSDLAISPSNFEAFPMTVIEAAAVGTPVVATAVGDVRAVLERTGAGIAVPAGDAEAFHRACRDVLSDGALRERLAESGRGSRDFDASALVSRHERLFAAAAAGRRLEATNGVRPAAGAGGTPAPSARPPG